MKIHFLGVGEACDERCPNTSLILQTKGGQHFLLDCGFTTPHLYFASYKEPDELDCVWISHFHGDHFFGIPLLLLRFWEMERRKNLFIAGPPLVKEKVLAAMELSYPGFLSRLMYQIDFMEVGQGESFVIAGTDWQTAANIHSQFCLSVCINDGSRRFFYSGDGRSTAKTQILAKNCDLVVHEAYLPEDELENHGSVSACLDFASRANVRNLALVHLQRNVRELVKRQIVELQRSSAFQIFIPEPGDRLDL